MNIVFPFTNDRGTFRPEIPIGICDPSTGKMLLYNGVIDSGADVTVIPHQIFKKLGINYKDNAISDDVIYGVSGEAQTSWEYNLDILILKEKSIEPFTRRSNVRVSCIESESVMVLLEC